MAPSGKIIISISSDEDEGCSKRSGQFSNRFDLKQKKKLIDKYNIKKDLDDDCVILDGDPYKTLRFENESAVLGSESDELAIVAEKGQVACRDYPHARHLCARFPFNTNPHEKYCALCHCYVCDMPAPCDDWGSRVSSGDHCHATDKEEIWRVLRQYSKQGKMAQLPALNHPLHTLSNAPTLHPTTSLSRSLSGGEGRAVTVGSMVTAFDQLTVQTDRLTGTVKWYSCQLGYGFIIPDSGGEDLFVHRSSIKSVGHRSLAEGEAVEFHIESKDDGRIMAIEVTGLSTSFVQGTATRGSYLSDARECYKCGETGHLAKDCVICYNCGKAGRFCSCTGSETDGNDSDDSDTGRYNYCSEARKCYICGETGHLARNCLDCYSCGKTGHLASTCSYTGSPTSGNDFDGSGTGRHHYCSDTRKCYVCGEAGHLAKNCSHTRGGSAVNDGSDIRKDDLCSEAHQNNCGETSHSARNHSYTRSESDNNDTRRDNHIINIRDCYNCGKTGHLARNCPNTGSESDDNDNIGSDTRRGNCRTDTRGCYNCGRTGHFARNCSFTQSGSKDTDNNDSDTSEGGQLLVQAEILTGTVKWFSTEKGYGFIIPDGGGEDLFVHQSSIKSKGYRSLAVDEKIEFQIERGDDGRKKAVDVTGPGGSFVQGTPRRVSHIIDTRNLYYGQTGHLASNRSYTGSSIEGNVYICKQTGRISYGK